MRRNWDAVWLIARREFLDQFRDWRIIVPMFILVSLFPFIADNTTRQAVNFMNRFGGDLILDRIVPFAVLVIGFFPLSFTLIVALESFVGEKERGTIEPLLSSPLGDNQMYLGKLLVGIATPLLFSYGSIGIYLLLLARRAVQFPSAYMMTLILLLTFAHAVLMVSAAIVISVQATTIRAANLLASFVVVPVAFLLQGETVLIFWGDESVLFYAVIGLTILSGLLIRLGLSHFKREYLLGREIDTLNFKSMGRAFLERVTGNAKSIVEWYTVEIPSTLRQLRRPLLIILGVAVLTVASSYLWVVINTPKHIDLTPDKIDEFQQYIRENLGNLDVAILHENIPAHWVFLSNVRATVLLLVAGLMSFSTIGITLFMVNMALIGGFLGGASLIHFSPFLVFVVAILPHGIFELTAVIISTAAVLKLGAMLVTPQPDKSLGEIFLLSLADWFRVFIGLVVPLLAIAAVVEVYVTPQIIKMAFPYL
ncbi:MAG TPA: stage II sporulation protein M [Anaerolineales bacterium]|nr:stage II sporulation protein M [Anaerolineales bacterium]